MNKIKIGFVPAHREPFDETWAAEMRKRCLAVFKDMENLEIVVPDENLTQLGCVRNDNDAEKAITLFSENDIDGLIIGTMTFGDEVAALAVASAFRDLPVYLFGTKEGPFTADGNRRSDSFCGTLSISSGLHRRDITFFFGGIVFPEEDEFKDSVENFLRVCSIGKGFYGANIGLVGPRPERFETCIFSEDALMRQFEQKVVPVALPEIMEVAFSGDNRAEVDKIIAEIRKTADISSIDEKTLAKIGGLEYALRDFARRKDLTGIGVQCWNAMQSIYGLSPCFAMGRLTDAGIMTACEVDIYGVLTMLIQYLASMKTAVPHFIDWTIQHQEKENTFLAWHCGNAPSSLVCQSCKVELSYQSVLGASLGIDHSMGTGEFQLKPGPVTLNRLQEYDGMFKMFIAGGNAVQSDQKLRGSWSWVEVPDLDNLYRTLVMEGFTHHASLIHGDYIEAIADACDYLGIEAVIA